MEPVYTLICEYDGGTYVSQVSAIDEFHAVTVWAERFSQECHAPASSSDAAKAIRENLGEGENPIRLQGLKNAWCSTAMLGENLVLLNIVKTSLD